MDELEAASPLVQERHRLTFDAGRDDERLAVFAGQERIGRRVVDELLYYVPAMV